MVSEGARREVRKSRKGQPRHACEEEEEEEEGAITVKKRGKGQAQARMRAWGQLGRALRSAYYFNMLGSMDACVHTHPSLHKHMHAQTYTRTYPRTHAHTSTQAGNSHKRAHTSACSCDVHTQQALHVYNA